MGDSISEISELMANAVISKEEILEKIEKIKQEKFGNDALFTFFQNQSVQRYFKYDLKKYYEVISSVMSKISEPAQITEILKNDAVFCKTLIGQSDFYSSSSNDLFLTLINATVKFNQDQSVFEEISQTLQKCVFKNSIKTFELHLNGEKQVSCKHFFKFLTSLYSLNEHQARLGFKLIFYSLCKSQNNFGLTYKMLILLCEMIGFKVKDNFDLSKIKIQNPEELSLMKSLVILNEIFDVFTKLKCELDYKINETSFSEFILNLIKSLISLGVSPNDVCYKILMKVIEINPLIAESAVNEIIVYTMLADNSLIKNEYEEVMIKMLEVFSKLHRIQNFISKMIPTLKSSLNDRTEGEIIYPFIGCLDLPSAKSINYDVNLILPKDVLDYFSNCIIDLASWQVMNVFKTLLHHLNNGVTELSEFKTVNSEFIYFEILSTLTCCFLSSVRMAEHTITSSSVEKFTIGLEELKTILGKFGTNLVHREHNRILMRAFLNICYNWAEVYLILSYYNAEISMNVKRDADFTSCNLTYLHSYLDVKQWCLIYERITNFGEKPCKTIMRKLIIQKLKASLILENRMNEDMVNPIIKDLFTNFDEDVIDIYMDKFVINNLLKKVPAASIMNLSKFILKEFFDGNIQMSKFTYFYDCPFITKGLLTALFTKINKLLKQKRKVDDNTIKRAFCYRAISSLPSEIFLHDNLEEYFGKIPEILSVKEDNCYLDLKVYEDDFVKYFTILKAMPVVYLEEIPQKLLVILLLALQRDLIASNCEKGVQNCCEDLIIGIIQNSKITLLDIFDANILTEFIVTYFDNYHELFSCLANNIFKNEEAIRSFQASLDLIHFKDDKYSRCGITVFNLLNKARKSKISPEAKELCLQFRSTLCNKIVKTVTKKQVENRLVEPYALVLKTYITKDEDNNLEKLKNILSSYVEFCLSNLATVDLKGSLLLFVTILHHKPLLNDLGDEFILKLWESLQVITIGDEVSEEYSQLVILVSSHIHNEQFPTIMDDLLKATEKSIEVRNNTELIKQLKIWTSILSTNFNPIKTNIFSEKLELLLQRLIAAIQCGNFQEGVVEKIIQFKVSVIQTVQFPLSAPMIDIFILTVTFLMIKTNNFVKDYNLSLSILESLLKHRNPLIMDRLPPYLQQYRILLRELCVRSNSNTSLEENELKKIADCAHQLEKLTRNLVACTRDMARISLYLIADILEQYELISLFPNVKVHLNNCVYSLISLCDQHAVRYLATVLSNASTELFKVMYENYKKYYRFTGKV